MKTLDEIRKAVPYVKRIGGNTYATEMTIGNKKGSVIFGWEGVWEHISFSPYGNKLPSWDDMCELKDTFFRDDEIVIQMHPKKSEYVNIRENCLHLWRMKEIEDLIEKNR